ncbi:unnamed protein product [Owenia fusiformis]|uniref:Uncharacterized protein n=1 Tax=Owenia fusiformis TaxID=6347 RepID=A0A8S4N5R2_OWEFU|nr:unnamed protein product [Owenia fusiformis]
MFHYFCFLIFLMTPHIAKNVEILDNEDNFNTTVAPINEHTEVVEEHNATEQDTSGDGELAPTDPISTTTLRPLSRSEKEYKWDQDPQGNIGKSLYGGSYRLVEGTHLVTQCAKECITDPQCKSYNFDKSAASCELNDETADDISKLIEAENKVYIEREEFQAEPDAVGVCQKDLCKNDGYCMNTELANGKPSYACICKEKWGGTNCTEPAGHRDWGDWEEWSVCSVTCGNGYSHRKRRCMDSLANKEVSPLDCFGRDMEFKICTVADCPRWESWSDWEECSTFTTCGRGFKTRTRTCSNGGIPGKDRLCMGPLNETTPCEEPSCDAPLKLARGEEYGEGVIEIYNDKTKLWGDICYDGFDTSAGDIACKQIGFVGLDQVYKSGSPPNGDYLTMKSCKGDEVALQQCVHEGWKSNANCLISAGIKCIVNGDWANWSKWGNCSVTCAEGIRTRIRTCTHPPNLRGGTACEGEEMQTKPCSKPSCPVDGEYTQWSTWGDCSVTCAGGQQSRSRECTGQAHGGSPCEGPSYETRDCNTAFCPVDGYVSKWGDWENCSLECGGGVTHRVRHCIGPFYDGKDCAEPLTESRMCNTHFCPVDGILTTWGDWIDCNVTCGGGVEWRHRTCIGPFYEGAPCPGALRESQLCNTQPCPVDGVWELFSDWSVCSVTCGGGSRYRTRNCTGPYYGGAECQGDSQETEPCNTNSCMIPGEWLDWGPYGLCDQTCDAGKAMRKRECNMTTHAHLTDPCIGNDTMFQTCNNISCNPVPSCSYYYELGLRQNTTVDIDPDGPDGENEPFQVFCDMTTTEDGITYVLHDMMERTQVQGYEGAGEYTKQLIYANNTVTNIAQVTHLVDYSLECKQFIKWECKSAILEHQYYEDERTTFWQNRYGIDMKYWGGGPPDGYGCACGLNHSCADPAKTCNCDANDDRWGTDEGFITKKLDLPVTSFLAGDTGETESKEDGTEEYIEQGYGTVGPLICSGRSTPQSESEGGYSYYNYK